MRTVEPDDDRRSLHEPALWLDSVSVNLPALHYGLPQIRLNAQPMDPPFRLRLRTYATKQALPRGEWPRMKWR